MIATDAHLVPYFEQDFTYYSGVSIVHFDQINESWVYYILLSRMESIEILS